MDALSQLIAFLGAGQDGTMTVGRRGDVTYRPTMNVYQDPEKYVVMVALPGAKDEDISLEIEEIHGEQHIHLHAKIRDPFEKKGERTDPESPKQSVRDIQATGYVVMEYPLAEMDRCLGMPSDVNPHKIIARLENGLLQVVLPREKERTAAKPFRTIKLTGKQD